MYIDSDILLYDDVEVILNAIDNKDVGIFRHRQFNLSIDTPEGHYNVGIVYFKNSDIGKQVLNWWADAVLFKKYPILSTCGDQKYLDEFPRMCENIFIDGELAHHIYTPLTMYTNNEGLKIIYDDYFDKIKKTNFKYNK